MESYYVKDVLLGLKKEYVEYAKLLDKIKSEVVVEGNDKLKDFRFYLDKSYIDVLPELMCEFEMKNKNKFSNTVLYTRNNAMIAECGNVCIYGNTQTFKKSLRLLFNSEFANSMKESEIRTDDENTYLDVDYNGINYYWFNKENGRNAKLSYNPISDMVNFTSTFNISKSIVEDMLYTSISQDNLPLYHQRVMETCELSKPLEVLDAPKKLYQSEKSTDFEPMELTNQQKFLVLRNLSRR